MKQALVMNDPLAPLEIGSSFVMLVYLQKLYASARTLHQGETRTITPPCVVLSEEINYYHKRK